MLNLSVLLEDSARRYPDRDALVFGDERLTYAQVDRYANQVANLLVSRGVAPGDKVALSCPNLPQFPIVYYGILKAGAVVVPLNVLLREREIDYHLADSDAQVYVCFEGTPELPMGVYGRAGFDQTPGCREMLLITTDSSTDPAIPDVETLAGALEGQPAEFDTATRELGDTAVILYTSGTTGKPKGAELTHANMTINALAANRLFSSDPTRHDTHLLTLPLFHSFGQTINLNAGFSVGATLVLLPRFDARAALALMERERITVFAGVPTMYWSLLGALDDGIDVDRIAQNMRLAISGGAALPVETLTQFNQHFGIQICEGYGLSETSPLAIAGDPERPPRPGSIGVPVWGVEARLIDEAWNTVTGPHHVGEIALRGHNIMKGYHGRPDATAQVMHDSWFRTGDLAHMDQDGFYYIVDRAKDMIVRGGFNVYPREVEEVLMTHEAVSLAAVVGVPHESHGEEVKAFVILEPHASVTTDTLIAWAKEEMAGYKYPREIEFVESLPMTATGKILKRELIQTRGRR
ncbi:long-chain-fatty-acid--CoA ligase [Nocardia sp. CA-107356]|uniref:long-chain-fatty-acid--CoA ligase n=1 Tax=Nocardia sp. CA-107356 TaxID=3239972 RepID=UPI003D90CAEE